MMASLKHVQLLITLAILLLVIATTSSTCKCTSSASVVKGIYWTENPLFPPSSINTSHFTHVFYAFLIPNITTYTLQLPTSNDNTSLTTFTNTLRTKTPPATTLLSIGGGGSNSSLFAFIASNPTARATFINSTIQVSRTFGFDGIDLDWEFPQNPNEMNSLGELFLQWRYAITAEAVSTGRKPLLLTAAVYFAASVPFPFPPRMYPIDSINKNLDWINVMLYDLRGKWNNVTGAPAGLVNPNSNVTVTGGLISWIRAGIIPEKVVMGIPLYAKTWELRDPNVNGIGAPAAGVGPGWDGAMAFFQVLEFNNQTGTKVVYDADTGSVYSYSGTTWVGYDDPFTVSVKVGLAQALSLRGYFFWVAGLDTSDWKISTQGNLN